MAIVQNKDPLEPRLDPDLGLVTSAEAKTTEDGAPSEMDWLTYLGEARRIGRTFQQNVALGEWEQSQSAYRSEHSGTSKYQREQYKNRSKYFKPKTRAAVRKNLTATANALFQSQEVMVTSAENDSDPVQRANADLIKSVISARFNSKSLKSGVPWLQTALGARFDAQLHASCCSKQSWLYKTVKKTVQVDRDVPVLDAYKQPVIDRETGQPMVQIVTEDQMTERKVIDRPNIDLIPPELVLLSPNAPWIDPAQGSPDLIVIWPMRLDDVKGMMNGETNRTPWREVSDDLIAQATYSETEIMGLRAAREGSGSTTKKTPDAGKKDGQIVEVWECFSRRDGVDHHCWTLKNLALLSDPVDVEEVYPEFYGARPYVIGTDVLEPHVLYKQAHVRSWRQSQDEINDFTNLHMDGTRQSVFPTAKVVAGKNIDYKAVQRRDGQGIILVREQSDVEWDRAPGPPANSYQEVNLLMNDFDEIAGIFSQNSVQSNRSLNETVGGMQMISSNANATSEFDLRIWIDTWVEPVLSQVVMLEQYYEDDQTILTVAGQKAKLWQKHGVDQITDDLLSSQVNIGVDVNIGSSDPMHRLMKFKTTFDIAMPMLSLAMQQGMAKPRFHEIFNEIFGQAGYRDGADRFIELSEDGQGQPAVDPQQMQKLQEELQALQQENQQLQLAVKNKGQEIQMKAQASAQETALAHRGRMAEIDANNQARYQEMLLGFLRDTIDAQISAGTQTNVAALDAQVQSILGLMGHVSGQAKQQGDMQIAREKMAATQAPSPQGA